MQIGLQLGNLTDFKTFDELWNAWCAQVEYLTRYFVELCNFGVDIRIANVSKLIKSCMTEACIERGLQLDEGGAIYNYGCIETGGHGTVGDSLYAIKKLVYDEKKITPHELDAALKANFEGYEEIRLMLRNVPKYGNGHEEAYSNDPTAFIAAAVNPTDKLLYIYDEHYETRMLNNQIAAMIVGKGYSKERIRADCAEPKSNDELRRLGISRLTKASKGADSVRHGIDTIQQYRIIVKPSCQNTISELSSYIWAKNNDGSGKDKPVDKNNHLMDALRYAMEDVTYFHPTDPEQERKWQRQADGGLLVRGGLSAADFKGGWE